MISLDWLAKQCKSSGGSTWWLKRMASSARGIRSANSARRSSSGEEHGLGETVQLLGAVDGKTVQEESAPSY
jgi:hypothetical protein